MFFGDMFTISILLCGSGIGVKGTWNTGASFFGEDMPRKPLDVETRITLCFKEVGASYFLSLTASVGFGATPHISLG